MKAFNAFIKPFEASQRSMKIRIQLNFFSSPRTGTGRFNMVSYCKQKNLYQIMRGKRKSQTKAISIKTTTVPFRSIFVNLQTK